MRFAENYVFTSESLVKLGKVTGKNEKHILFFLNSFLKINPLINLLYPWINCVNWELMQFIQGFTEWTSIGRLYKSLFETTSTNMQFAASGGLGSSEILCNFAGLVLVR